MERENLDFDVKGDVQAEETVRARVPKRSPGADRPVVVKKPA